MVVFWVRVLFLESVHISYLGGVISEMHLRMYCSEPFVWLDFEPPPNPPAWCAQLCMLCIGRDLLQVLPVANTLAAYSRYSHGFEWAAGLMMLEGLIFLLSPFAGVSCTFLNWWSLCLLLKSSLSSRNKGLIA